MADYKIIVNNNHNHSVTPTSPQSYGITLNTGTLPYSNVSNVPPDTLLGNNTNALSNTKALTPTQAKSLLSISNLDITGLGALSTLSVLPLNDISSIPNNTILGNSSGSSASPTALSVNSVQTILGLGTAAYLNVGTSANNIVQLDGNAKLPAIDGSQLTGIGIPIFTTSNNTSYYPVFFNSTSGFLTSADVNTSLTYNPHSETLNSTILNGTITGNLAGGTLTSSNLSNATLTSPLVLTSLTTTNTSFNLLNTTATTINFGGTSTALNIGSSTGTTTINNKLSHNGLVLTSGTNVDQITVITVSLTLTTDWQNTGISYNNLATGTYVVQLFANDAGSGGTNNNEYYSGIMSWYAGNTNSSLELPSDEIELHRAGGSNDGELYLRTYRSPSSSGTNLLLQIYSNASNPSASNYVFKFRRVI